MNAKVTYTPEQTLELISVYKEAPTVETIEAMATKFGKTVKSIIAKLSRENVYVKPEKATASAGKRVNKEDLVAALNVMVGVEMKSAINMTVKDLQALINFIRIEGNTDGTQLTEAE